MHLVYLILENMRHIANEYMYDFRLRNKIKICGAFFMHKGGLVKADLPAVFEFYTTLTTLGTIYLTMCKVYTDIVSYKLVKLLVPTLKLMNCFPLQAYKQ